MKLKTKIKHQPTTTACHSANSLKTLTRLLVASALCLLVGGQTLPAQLAIPSDGSDGALLVLSDTVIDLGQAATGVWTNKSANAGQGIYDPNQWAVVFKYSSVVIPEGVTVTFSNHPTHAPVVWLVNGDVTIDGTLSLDGQSASTDPVNLPEPGPGGFRGGSGASQAGFGAGSGFGPGGIYQDWPFYSTPTYGNPQIVPLIGGSGGSGCSIPLNGNVNSGTGGGGAILIAASGTITMNGSCHANGGYGPQNGASFAGDGGGIRFVANQILGKGTIQALGGCTPVTLAPGRIRLEANTASASLDVNPPTTAVAPTPLVIWPATNAPTVQVVSVANLAAPADPKAAMSAGGDDLTLATTNTVAILLQTGHFPITGTVNVFIKPRNAAQSILQASYVSGDNNSATWQLNTVLPLSHTVIQARAVSN